MVLENKAREFCIKAHEGQVRKFSDEPFHHHPIAVASLVSKFTNNQDLIDAAYLHDVVEDTEYDFDDLSTAGFNRVVCEIVYDLTKHYTKEEYPDKNREWRNKAEIHRLKDASWSAKLIKLCDRVCNVKDLAKQDSTWAPDHYYALESIALVIAIGDVCPQLSQEIRAICAYGASEINE